ncbi:hypothetical protein WR51_05190 [Bacillus cereus]|nr:hypothetical protein WR47_05180 [Bacillus cereus]ANC12312.1 hypothetical protein WR51_05190 [Bacillus cereus]OUB14851.1 hypothetical protein BK733_23110 [Bacillus thuringiensis serovar xiaguangiensis]
MYFNGFKLLYVFYAIIEQVLWKIKKDTLRCILPIGIILIVLRRYHIRKKTSIKMSFFLCKIGVKKV